MGLPSDTVEKILPFFQLETLSKNATLTKKGQTSRKLCFVRNGYLRFYSYSDDKAVTHWIFGKGQLVTDVAGFFLREPAKWNIQALSETEIDVITYDSYEKMRISMPEWVNYEKLLLVRLMSALENRVYAFLSMSAEERFQHLFDANPQMFNQLPLQYLSSMLGMTPETLSRIRRKKLS